MDAFTHHAQWISGPAYEYGPDDAGYYQDHRNHVLLRTLDLAKVPASAQLRVAVLGFARAYLNGKRVTTAELVGDWTNYTKLVYFNEYEVAGLLHEGGNELRIELGNGWYNPSPLTLFGKYNLRERLAEVGTPAALVELVTEDQDGEKALLVSDDSWTYTEGNLVFNNIYLGERRDLRLVEPAPLPVRVVGQNSRTLAPTVVPPIRRFQTVTGVDAREVQFHGEPALLVDLHEMVTGFASLSFVAHAGDVVTVRYAEVVGPDGLPIFDSNHAGMVGTTIPHAKPDGSDVVVPGGPGAPATGTETDTIVCREGENHFESEFSAHSFRYALVTGISRAALRRFRATYVHTAVAPAGSIRTGNAWYDQMIDAALRTKLNNIHGTWEDCAREHLGYGGDMVALATSNLFTYDAGQLIAKVLRDFRNDQTAAGGVPETAPYMGIQSLGTGQGGGPLLWQLAYPYLTFKAYQWYGARDLVASEWPYICKLTDYLLGWDPEELAEHCLGDHGSISTKKQDGGDWKGGTPDREFTSWCAILQFAELGSKLAAVVQDSAAQERYAEAAAGLRTQIADRFQHADGSFADGTQTSYAFAGGLGLMDRQAAGDSLASLMQAEGNVLSCGIFGASFAWSLLHQTGHDDAVEAWLNREDSPSYRHMLANGSGALAEMFEPTVDSYNHAMFSSYVQWFYEALGGITVADDAVAANHVRIQPYFSHDTDRMAATYPTPAGNVTVSWTRETPASVQLTVTIPSEVQADVQLPANYVQAQYTSQELAEGLQQTWLLSLQD